MLRYRKRYNTSMPKLFPIFYFLRENIYIHACVYVYVCVYIYLVILFQTGVHHNDYNE